VDAFDAVLDQAFEDLVRDVVEVRAVVDLEGDALFVGQLEDLEDFGVEEDFAVIGDFNVADGGVGLEEVLEIGELQDPAADRGFDGLGGGRSGGTAQLAARGDLEADTLWFDERGSGGHGAADAFIPAENQASNRRLHRSQRPT